MIEILVVILIIGILVAVAAPSFLGQADKAHDSVAQQYLAMAWKAAVDKTPEQDGVFAVPSAVVTQISQSEPEIVADVGEYSAAASATVPSHVFVSEGSAPSQLVLFNHSGSGTVWCLIGGDGAQATTKGPLFQKADAGGCGAAGLPAAPVLGPCDSTGATVTTVDDCAPDSQPSGQRQLVVTPAGDGVGTVDSAPAGIDCGRGCVYNFDITAQVTLTATPADGSLFVGWAGDCSGTDPVCTVSMDDNRDVEAIFDSDPAAAQYRLDVEIGGSGAGAVSSSPSGIDCGVDCSQSFDSGTLVTLTATAWAGSTFAGWAGDCDSTETSCVVPIDKERTVEAVFDSTNPPPGVVELSVSLTGTGSGYVSSDPVGVSCLSECVSAFSQGTTVKLVATSTGQSHFAGWLGDGTDLCQTTIACNVTLDQSRHVQAVFEHVATARLLRVALGSSTSYASNGPGPGQGAVWSSDTKIICQPNCAFTYPDGHSLTLYAIPMAGSAFDHWEGACAASTGSSCDLTMDSDKEAVAVFTKTSSVDPPTCQSGCGPTDPPVCYEWVVSHNGGSFSSLGSQYSTCGTDGGPFPPIGDGSGSDGLDGGPSPCVSACSGSSGSGSTDPTPPSPGGGSSGSGAGVPAGPSGCASGDTYAIVYGNGAATASSASYSCGGTPPGCTSTGCQSGGVICTTHLCTVYDQGPVIGPAEIILGGGPTDYFCQGVFLGCPGYDNGGGDWEFANVSGNWVPGELEGDICANSVPTSTGSPQVADPPLTPGQPLTAIDGTWSGSPPLRKDHQWQVSDDGVNWTNVADDGSLSQYLPASAYVGKYVRFKLTVSNGGSSTVKYSNAVGPLVPVTGPVDLIPPSLFGSVQLGGTITTDGGSWDGDPTPTLGYQWQSSADDGASWTDLAGANSSALTLSNDDLGLRLRVLVNAHNTSGDATAASPESPVIGAAGLVNTAAPTLSSAAQPGQSLMASNGSWTYSEAPVFAYQWQRSDDGSSWADVSGATARSYTITTQDVGYQLRIQVTAANSGATVVVYSAASQTVFMPDLPALTQAPSISGSATTGAALSGDRGSWSNSPTSYAYQWRRCDSSGASCADVAGATTLDFSLSAADVGHTLRLRVTAANAAGSATASSAATAVVTGNPPANTALPTVSGTAQEGDTLTASQGSWSGSGNSYAYQWQRTTDDGANWADVSTATDSSYTLTAADVGDKLRVQVTAANADGSATASSAKTALVNPQPAVNRTPPAVSGSPIEGQSLTASQGSWDSSQSLSYSYQWQSCAGTTSGCANVAGATASTYVVRTADVGRYLRAVVTAENSGGSVAAASDTVGPAQGLRPLATSPAPAISGTAQQGQTLQTTNGGWTNSPSSYAYQWQYSSDGVNWTDDVGQTAQSYTLWSVDVGKSVRVEVWGCNAAGCALSPAASQATAVVVVPAPVNTALPTISGTFQVGQTLTASTGNWSYSPSSYSYQWQTSSDSGATWADIVDATSSTYTVQLLPGSQPTLRVAVTAFNSSGAAVAYSTSTTSINATYSQYVVGDGATTYWQLGDGSGNFADSSGNNHTGATGGVPTYHAAGPTLQQGQTNYAVNFNDSGYLTASAGTLGVNTSLGTSETAEFWMYLPAGADTSSSQFLVAFSGTNTYYGLLMVNGLLGFCNGSGHCYSASVTAPSGGVASLVGRWTHVVAVFYNGAESNDVLYFDGVAQSLSGAGGADSSQITTGTMAVATAPYAAGTLIYRYSIDEVALYPKALTATQAATHFQSGAAPTNTALPVVSGSAQQGQTLSSTQGSWNGANSFAYQWQRGSAGGSYKDAVLADGPQGYWRLNETGTPATVADSSGNSHPAATGGTLTFGAAGPTLANNAANTALQYPTSGDGYFHFSPATVGLNSASGSYNSYEFWLYVPTNYNTQGPVEFAITLGTSNTYAGFGFNTAGQFGFWDGSGQGRLTSSALAATYAGQWIHIVAVFYNGTNLNDQLYINGSQVTSWNTYSAAVSWNGGDVYVGALNFAPASDHFFGKLDEFSAWKGQMSASTAAAHYAAAAAGYSTWSDISGATSTTYAVQAADSGAQLRSTVTATNLAGSTTVGSAATSTVP